MNIEKQTNKNSYPRRLRQRQLCCRFRIQSHNSKRRGRERVLYKPLIGCLPVNHQGGKHNWLEPISPVARIQVYATRSIFVVSRTIFTFTVVLNNLVVIYLTIADI